MDKVAVVLVVLTLVLIPISATNIDKAKDDGENPSNDMKKKASTTKMSDQDDEKGDGELLMQAMKKCNETYRIDMSFFTALNESGSFPDETIREPKCNIHCLLIKTGVSSEDGEFDAAQAAMVFAGMRGGKEMDDIEETASSCAEKRKERRRCQRSYQFVKCIMEMEIMKYEKKERCKCERSYQFVKCIMETEIMKYEKSQ